MLIFLVGGEKCESDIKSDSDTCLNVLIVLLIEIVNAIESN